MPGAFKTIPGSLNLFFKKCFHMKSTPIPKLKLFDLMHLEDTILRPKPICFRITSELTCILRKFDL